MVPVHCPNLSFTAALSGRYTDTVNYLQRSALFLLLLAVCASSTQADEILFIGNSFTFAAAAPEVRIHGGVPGLFEQIARGHGEQVETSTLAVGGADWSYHLANPATDAALGAKKWTWVVLQDLSTRPTHVGDVKGFMLDGEKFSRKIAANSSTTGILIYETWARQGDAFYQRAPGNSFSGPQQMMQEVHLAYDHLRADLAAQNSNREVRVAPIGTAFAQVALQYPAIHLEAFDHHHATAEGYYLAALVIDETLWGKSVRGAPRIFFQGGLKIPADDAEDLQKVADEVVGPLQYGAH